MRQDFFTYEPQFKLIIAGNHKPSFRNVDPAIRRRLHLVPFLNTPPKVDPDLMEKLRGEGSAILAWMIEGAVAWQRQGLTPPPSVTSATQEYFEEEDSIGRWLAEVCEVEPKVFTLTSMLLASVRSYCSETGEHAGTAKRLAQELKRRGFRPGADPITRRRGFYGIRPQSAEWLMELGLV